jgi:hypothetical protein
MSNRHFCGDNESLLHVQHNDVNDYWRKNVYDLEQELVKWQTDSKIVKHLTQGLLQWQQSSLTKDAELIHRQSLIGWDGIMEACLGQHWVIEQNNYYINNRIKKRNKMGRISNKEIVENSTDTVGIQK